MKRSIKTLLFAVSSLLALHLEGSAAYFTSALRYAKRNAGLGAAVGTLYAMAGAQAYHAWKMRNVKCGGCYVTSVFLGRVHTITCEAEPICEKVVSGHLLAPVTEIHNQKPQLYRKHLCVDAKSRTSIERRAIFAHGLYC